MNQRVKELVESSREVLRDVCIENGAVVAANSDKDYYPENVANYRFVWPRDAAYTLYALDILGEEEQEERFYDWLMERAEGFKDSGVIYHRYSTNGPRDTDFGHQFQPDQAAALLWTILETNKELDERKKEIIHLLADGLWSQWDEENFHSPTHDLWEEREAHPDMKENFSYTLAASSEALYLAADEIGEQKWFKTAEQMRERLEQHQAKEDGKTYYPRTFGDVVDETFDACNLGLVWPFNVVQKDEKLKNTVELIEEHLMIDEGIMRYPGDMYDGIIHHTKHLKKGAGAWPLLTFWYSIAIHELGRKEEAQEVFDRQVDKIEGEYFPEQIFSRDRQGIKPLAWSHSMFIIAAEKLGRLK
ncbi:MAG: glycoside hydrolase family 15 protein [Candidatus Nanohaloarchaea archaeon]